MSKRLYIIGNGFDRAHNLPTSYNPDFKRIAEKYESENFWEIYQSSEPNIWADFENLLGCPDFDSIEEIFDGYAPDYLSDSESDRDGIILQVDVNGHLMPALYKFAKQAESALENTNRERSIERILDKEAFYITFNYTHTLEEIYDISCEHVLHVHGEVGKDNLLMGYPKGKFTPEKYSYDVRQKGRGPYAELEIQDYIDEIEDYYIRIAYDELLDKCKSFNKDIKVDLVNSFLDKAKSQIEEIIVYGHSCEIDFDYFDAIKKRYPKAKWFFYVASYNQQDFVEQLIEKICIKDAVVLWVTYYNKLDYDKQIKYDFIVEKNCSMIKKQDLSTYVDPDIKIEKEITIDDERIRLGPDGICGIKYIELFLDGTPEEIAEAYKLIRSKLIMWPRHRQSINVRRYQCFRDRIDFTIFDIKQYYQNRESRLVKKDSGTVTYLDGLDSFESFLNEYDLQLFVDESGNVKNLANGGIISNYDEYEFSASVNKNYLLNLLVLLNELK